MQKSRRLTGWCATALVLCVNGLAANPDAGDGVHEMEPMVVTGTRTERPVSEAPVKTELVLPKDMVAYNVTSFRDALKLIPTARFENDCQNCGLNQIQLLGLSTDYTAILFDGAPLYSGLVKVYGADLFPTIFIDRIEIVKGGSSVLYGPEAMAGAVNLITREPVVNAFETGVAYKTILGDADEWEGTFKADYLDTENRFSFSAYGYIRDREGLDLTTDGFSEIPEFNSKVIGLKGWFHPGENTDFSVGYQFIDQEHRGGDQLDAPEEQARVAESLAHDVHMLQTRFNHRINHSMDISLKASYLTIERESFYGARGDNEQRAFEEAGFTGDVTEAFIADNQEAIDAVARKVWGLTENDVLYLDSQVDHFLGAHTVSWGIQYRYEELVDGSLFDSDTPTTEDDFSNLGAYVQDQWEISPALEIVPGIRVDDHDNVDGTIFSPRLAARYFASELLTVRASWSTGFNAPGAFNEDQHIGVNNGGAIILNNAEDLVEERSSTFSLGLQFQPEVKEGQLVADTQLHYTRLEDAFEIDDSGEVTGDENLWLRINGPDAKFLVWENSLNWQVNEHLRFDAGISYIHARLDEAIERVTGLVTDELPERPEWTGQLGMSYLNHDLFNAHALLSYTGSMLAIGEDSDVWRETDPFYVLDIGISKDFDSLFGIKHFTVSVGIDNVFDDRQKDFQNNGEERDPTYIYGPSTPRTWYLRLSATW